MLDKHGQSIDQRQYNTKDFDRTLVLEKRTELVARRIWEYLQATDPMAKTIVFCDDQDHAERMRQALVKLIPAASANRRYVMRITGDDTEGKSQLSYFIDNDEPYPVIATTSKLLTTGVDAKTCKLIVLDQTINSMSEFKQIVGRGTRIREDYQKLYFTIMDFKGATRLFADPDFDGDPVAIYEPTADEPVIPPEQMDQQALRASEPSPPPFGTTGSDPSPTHRGKYYVQDVAVRAAVERSQYLDINGRLITEDYRVFLRDEIRRALQTQFGSLTSFLRHWSSAERKQAVIDELREQGMPLDVLLQAIPNGSELDVFDLVAHIAFDQKPLTRRERANNVRKQNTFAKYGEQARAVLEALLEKYADHGIADIEDPKVLELPPINQYGTRTQIRRTIFGGPEKYSEAITELEQALYDEESA
jgi:type I restriction enzyme R subunit